MLKMTVRGLSKLRKDLRAESKRQKKALDTAIKVEGFRLRKLLIKEIKAGAPGGRRFRGMRAISRWGGDRFTPNKPLANKGIWKMVGGAKWRGWSMADVVRYDYPDGPGFQMAIGWTGPQVSKSWKRLALAQQEGLTVSIPSWKRKFLAQSGGRMGKRSRNQKFFFLRKATRRFEIPARPVIDPFWSAHKTKAMSQIRHNFRQKLRGKRI